MVIADDYTVSTTMALFSFANTPTASISLSMNGLHANIQGTDDHIPIKKAGVLKTDTLNWLIVGFGSDDRISRLVIDLTSIDLSELYQNLSDIFDRSGVSLNRIPQLDNQEKP